MTGGWVERGGVRPKGACPIGEGLDRRVVNGEERGRERRRARAKARETRRARDGGSVRESIGSACGEGCVYKKYV